MTQNPNIYELIKNRPAASLLIAIGMNAAGTALGAAILPEMAACLIGGFEMIAAAGAVSACFVFGFGLTSAALGKIIYFLLMTQEQQNIIEQSINEHRNVFHAALFLSFSGGVVGSTFAASIIMGQPFLPLFTCMIIGFIVLCIGFGIINDFYNHQFQFDNTYGNPPIFN